MKSSSNFYDVIVIGSGPGGAVSYSELIKHGFNVCLLESGDDYQDTNIEEFEESLITHNHLELVQRIIKHSSLSLSKPHNELLALLGKFYKSYRYNRFIASSVYDVRGEREVLIELLSKYLEVNIEASSIFATQNEDRYKTLERIDKYLSDPDTTELLVGYSHSFGRKLNYPSVPYVFGILCNSNRWHILNYYVLLALFSIGAFVLGTFVA